MKTVLISSDLQACSDAGKCLNIRYGDCKVVGTDSGIRGLELVNAEAPDIVLIDSVLKDISILECIKKIREISDVGIIFLTEERPELYIVELLEAGADDYIIKPIIPLEFLARIRALLRQACHQKEISSFVLVPYLERQTLL